jgi:hypothetical protein
MNVPESGKFDRTGGAVTLGVWILILRSAFANSVSRKVFRGVGGARTLPIGAISFKRGFRRWGLGRKTARVLTERGRFESERPR